MGQPWDESMDEHGTIFQTMDEHETWGENGENCEVWYSWFIMMVIQFGK
jgi:hypothetical protein